MDLVTVRTDRTLPLVSLDGELDIAGVDAVSAQLVDSLRSRGSLVADLATLRFLDCAGIGMLVGVQLQARRLRRRLVLARPTQPVRRLLAAAAAVDLLEVYLRLDEALGAAGADRVCGGKTVGTMEGSREVAGGRAGCDGPAGGRR